MYHITNTSYSPFGTYQSFDSQPYGSQSYGSQPYGYQPYSQPLSEGYFECPVVYCMAHVQHNPHSINQHLLNNHTQIVAMLGLSVDQPAYYCRECTQFSTTEHLQCPQCAPFQNGAFVCVNCFSSEELKEHLSTVHNTHPENLCKYNSRCNNDKCWFNHNGMPMCANDRPWENIRCHYDDCHKNHWWGWIWHLQEKKRKLKAYMAQCQEHQAQMQDLLQKYFEYQKQLAENVYKYKVSSTQDYFYEHMAAKAQECKNYMMEAYKAHNMRQMYALKERSTLETQAQEALTPQEWEYFTEQVSKVQAYLMQDISHQAYQIELAWQNYIVSADTDTRLYDLKLQEIRSQHIIKCAHQMFQTHQEPLDWVPSRPSTPEMNARNWCDYIDSLKEAKEYYRFIHTGVLPTVVQHARPKVQFAEPLVQDTRTVRQTLQPVPRKLQQKVQPKRHRYYRRGYYNVHHLPTIVEDE